MRVTLGSGKTVAGTVGRITHTGLVLTHRGNYGDTDLFVRFVDIEKVVIRDQSDAHLEKGWFLTLGVLAVVSAWLTLRSYDLN